MMRNIAPKEIVGNPFAMIGDQWMLITAGDGENCNTMDKIFPKALALQPPATNKKRRATLFKSVARK